MIVMLDTPQSLDDCARDLGCDCEQLFTPLTRRNAQKPHQRFAMDNGAFSKFEPAGFLRMLDKHRDRIDLCRFVAVPDVVGSAIRTIECWNHWHKKLDGWPLAFVCQDGQENFEIPWNDVSAVFIGGSTNWKIGHHAAAIVKASKVLGKWCHIGRVNTSDRFEYFKELGADSCDGTGLAQYSNTRHGIRNGQVRSALQPELLTTFPHRA